MRAIHYAFSVVLTCANFMSAEMHLPKTPSDLTRWQALVDYEARLLEVYKKFTDKGRRRFRDRMFRFISPRLSICRPPLSNAIVDYGLSKYPERFSIQNCQLSGRREDTGKMS
jgi:hypothetical protein